MTPQTLKMLVMFILAAGLLNATNYLFYWLYDPPSRQALRLEVQVQERSKFTRFLTKRRITRIPKWSNFLLCENNISSSNKPVSDIKSASPEYDYRGQNSDSSAFYYYNRKGENICPEIPPGLGPIKNVDFSKPQEIEKLYTVLQPGGIYEEAECVPRQSVAIVAIYRDNYNQLHSFLNSLHTFLLKQQLEYQIFVVEQSNKATPLNPGKLFNVGFSEAHGMKKTGEWRCVVFHEHNIIPTDSRNLYRCSNQPQQLVTQLDNRSYKHDIGGAVSVNPKQFLKVNGFSNLYQSDSKALFEDFQRRLLQANYSITKAGSYGKYESVKHFDKIHDTRIVSVNQTMQTSSPLNLIDGLSTLSYTLNNIDLKPLYTLINVDIDIPQSNSTNLVDQLLNQATTTGNTIKKL